MASGYGNSASRRVRAASFAGDWAAKRRRDARPARVLPPALPRRSAGTGAPSFGQFPAGAERERRGR